MKGVTRLSKSGDDGFTLTDPESGLRPQRSETNLLPQHYAKMVEARKKK